MAHQPPESAGKRPRWTSPQVFVMAGLCLALGLLLGYIFRDSGVRDRPEQSPLSVQPETAAARSAVNPQKPTLGDMRHMAEKQSAPILLQLKKDPRNARLWNQVGMIYKAAHQFQEAVGYYEKALQLDPKNVAARTDMASCLYYQGDVPGALRELQQSLQYAPADANSLFNLGMIRWQGKQDAQGAVAAWRELLKSNPGLPAGQRAEVERLIGQITQPGAANQWPDTK